MTMIKTWRERCEEHPDHEGIVTEQMIRCRMQEEIDELRQAIEQAETREWVGLTDDDVFELADTNLYDGGKNYGVLAFAKAIEQALKEKNHG
jgi:hypothetical protein